MKWTDIPAQLITHHPVIAFLLACAVSIFSGDIRRFFTVQPQNLRVWILKTRLLTAEAQLRRLEASRKDILIAFSVVMRTVLFVLLIIMALVGLTAANLSQQIYYAFHNSELPSAQPFMLLIASVAASRIIMVLRFLLRLENFDSAHPNSTSKIESLRSRLNVKALSRKTEK
jgi:Na+/melibiose symporter-like transporter